MASIVFKPITNNIRFNKQPPVAVIPPPSQEILEQERAQARRTELMVQVMRLGGTDKTDQDGFTLLTKAVNEGDLEKVTNLLNIDANPNLKDARGRTPLGLAAKKGAFKIAEALLNRKTNPNLVDGENLTPIHHAIDEDNGDLFCLFAKKGADLKKRYLTSVSKEAITLPLYALYKGKENVVKALKKAGFDVNASDEEGESPLNFCIRHNLIKMVELLKAALDANINQVDGNGRNPYFMAHKYNRLEILELLFKWKADIDLFASGISLLARVTLNLDSKKCELYKKYGADLKFNHDLVLLKCLCHAWGLEATFDYEKGDGKKVILSGRGMPSNGGLYMFQEFFKIFKSQMDLKDVRCFQRVFSEAITEESLRTNKDILEESRKRPVLILGGTKSHLVTFILFKNKLIYCNRGTGKEEFSVKKCSIHPREACEDLIQRLRSTYVDAKALKAMLKNLDPEMVNGFKLKGQKNGNCTWASIKAAFLGLLSLRYSDNDKCMKLYKLFSARSRAFFSDKYLKESSRHSAFVLEQLKAKLLRKLKAKKPHFDEKLFGLDQIEATLQKMRSTDGSKKKGSEEDTRRS